MKDRWPSTERAATGAWWVVFMGGLAVSSAMVWRSQLQGDQLNMLIRGWYFAFGGQWLHVGMPTSAGGLSPGGLLSLVVGGPLALWADDRAATLVVWLGGLAGFLILDRVAGRTLGASGRLFLVVFYWLNPWRLHYTSSLWNTNYMFFLAAVHFWCAYRMRQRPAFWATVIMVLVAGLGFQLHSGAAVFGFVSVVLWWRRVIRVNWWGVAVGIAATAAAYAPWALAVAARPEAVPGGTGFPFRNVILIQPFVKGIAYLVRYPSLALPGRVYGLDMAAGSAGDDVVSAVLSAVLIVLGWLSVLLPLAAYRRLLRSRRRLWQRRDWSGSDRQWLRGYAAWTLIGGVVAFAVSPTSVMFWQGFPVFHAAVLVLVLFVDTLRRRVPALARRLVAGWAAAAFVAAGLVCWGSPMFRQPGPPPIEDPGDGNYHQRITTDHPMYHDLNLLERHRMVIVGEGGYMPDLLRESGMKSEE